MEARSLENRHGIIPFSGNNFDNWKFRLRAVLKAQDIDDVLEETGGAGTVGRDETWRKKNNKAVMVIVQSIADSHLEYVKGIEDASKMLTKLEGIYAKKGTCSKFYLLEELVNLKYDFNSNIQDHFAKCDKIFRELKNVGSTFEQSDMACFLLLSMPSEFEDVVTAIRTLSENDLKMEFVKSRLLEFNVNKNSIKSTKTVASSFAAQRTIKCFKCGKLGHVRNVCGVKCFTCNKFGHRSRQCNQNKNKDSSSTNKANYARDDRSTAESTEQPVAFCAISSSQEVDEIVWFADSGATHHYVNKEEVLTNKKTFQERRLVQLAEKGKSMEATCVGDIEVVSIVENKKVPIILKNVMCVPDLRVNLLSISSIEKAEFKVVCSNGSIVIKKCKIVYAKGKRCGNLYKLVFSLQNSSRMCKSSSKTR